MTKELKKDKLIAAGLLAEGWHEDPPAGKVRIFRKGELLRCLWSSGVVRDSVAAKGSTKITDEEAAMWLAIGESVAYAPVEETQAAMDEIRAGGLESFETVDALMTDLNEGDEA